MNNSKKTFTLVFLILYSIQITSCGHNKDGKKVINLKDHEDKKYYHDHREKLFLAIENYDPKKCTELLNTYKNLAHTKYECKDKIMGHYYALPYLIKLEKETNTNRNFVTKKIALAKLLIQNTNSLKVLYNSFSYILYNIKSNDFMVTEITYRAIEELLKKIESKFSECKFSDTKKNKKLLEKYENPLSYEIMNFYTSFKKGTEKTDLREKLTDWEIKLMNKKFTSEEEKIIELLKDFEKQEQEKFLAHKYPKQTIN